MAYVVKISEKVLFVTGNQIQTPKDFEKQVEKKDLEVNLKRLGRK